VDCAFTQHFAFLIFARKQLTQAALSKEKSHRSEEMNRNYLKIVMQQATCASDRRMEWRVQDFVLYWEKSKKPAVTVRDIFQVTVS
jgi:hypothetical protein